MINVFCQSLASNDIIKESSANVRHIPIRLDMKLFLSILCSLLLLDSTLGKGQQCFCGKEKVDERIVNGDEAKPHTYPWMVGLIGLKNPIFDKHPIFCGGALINDRYVVTAAHCLDAASGVNVRDLKITLGAHYADSVTLVHEVANVTLHPDYMTTIKYQGFDRDTMLNDIALIKLKKPVVFSEIVKPICLPSKEVDEDLMEDIVVVGWGSTSQSASYDMRALALQEVYISPIDSNKCNNYYGPWRYQQNIHICAGKGDKDACVGDSGGPLMVKVDGSLNLVGVVSYGIEGVCGQTSTPGVYSKTAPYLDWIRKNTRDAHYCS